jgi:hypothetical protein
MSLPSSPSGDLSQSSTKYHSNEHQETIDTENHENHNSSNDGRDGLQSLDIWRTCPVALIRSDPVMRTIYDRGFKSGFYRHNSKQSVVESVITPPTKSTETSETASEIIFAGAEFESSSEAAVVTNLSAVDLTVGSAFDNAIESALDNAVQVAETSMRVALMARKFY